ncbi:lipoyl(octanoyl) transferase LipB [Pseudofrankia sp. DC12]|uniref:lipoyl(octanoyl) transferase LipB n=1 Tax=Pseudofrankia sp. DC12 TaxID=683315 RepID=UPI0005F877E0|nr:lipoyl(octanoyl) transferase LipB [Pseudofrankia sp. DC12]
MDVLRLPVVPYLEAWELQRDLAASRATGEAPDTLILLEHPDVYTAGRRTEDWERPADGTPVVDVDRGGKITWHGPGQLVGYPVVALPRPLDVVAYVRALEDAMIAVCAEFGVPAHRVEGRSGVWTMDDARKLGAIGIRVRQGVAYHGFALNCAPDLTAFSRIIACGITDASAGSLTAELDRTVTVAEARPVVERQMLHHLGAFLAGGRPSTGDGAILTPAADPVDASQAVSA